MALFKWVETVQMAILQLLMNKVRSGLTMLGIIIGVASVVILISLGQGVQDFILSSLSQFGSQFIIVTGATNAGPGAGQDTGFANSSLTEEDISALNQLSAIDKVAYTLTVMQAAVRDGERIEGGIAGVSLDYLEVLQFEVGSGRGLTQADLLNHERVALVGTEIVETAFDGNNPIGEPIRIGDVGFRIVGVLEPSAASLPGFSGDDSILIPITTAQRRLSGERTLDGHYPVSAFLLETQSEDVVTTAVDQITEALRITHELVPEEPSDFQVIAQQSVVDTVSSITNLLTAFLGAVAGISLFVGGIGIMNIMLVTVTERTREIGLRKAVGAQRGDILLQFLIEAVTIAIIGGLIGTAVAFTLTGLVSAIVPDLTLQVQISSILLAVVISVFVGTFFGAFPANRAASMNPIDALRYE